MVRLVKRSQLLAALETLPGTSNIGSATAVPVKTASIIPNPELLERELLTQTLTAVAGNVGQSLAGINVTADLAGTALGTFAGGAPGWGVLMQAAGFRQTTFGTQTAAAITGGPFRHGELVTGGTSAAIMRVIHDTYNGQAEMYVEVVSGTPTAGGELLTGQSTGATMTSTAFVADQGFAWYPFSTEEKSMSIVAAVAAHDVGEVIRGQTSGAIGIVTRAVTIGDTQIFFRPDSSTLFQNGETIDNLNDATTETIAAASNEVFVTLAPASLQANVDGIAALSTGSRLNFAISAEVNRPVTLTFNGQGVFQNETETPLATSSVSTAQAPLFRNAGFTFGTNAQTFAQELNQCIASFNLDMGNEINSRPCANDATGVRELLLTGRSATGSFDPEAFSPSILALIDQINQGAILRARGQVGTTNGNKFIFTVPGIQGSSAGAGDRNGIYTRDISFAATGGSLTNLNGGTVALESTGGDNEFVITYHTA